jgi:hypothetical protein
MPAKFVVHADKSGSFRWKLVHPRPDDRHVRRVVLLEGECAQGRRERQEARERRERDRRGLGAWLARRSAGCRCYAPRGAFAG